MGRQELTWEDYFGVGISSFLLSWWLRRQRWEPRRGQPGGRALLARTQRHPKLQGFFWGKKRDFWKHPFRPYPHVLVGELLHLLLVQAGEEELVLQLLRVLQGQQGGVGAGLDDALPDAQVHGGGLGHPRGGARVHSSCGDTKRGAAG